MLLGCLANEIPPRLRIVDAAGNCTDLVEFHPAYHSLMQKSMGQGLHCSTFESEAPGIFRPQDLAGRFRTGFVR
jgi:putative acyl-CoA dehydrogenase